MSAKEIEKDEDLQTFRQVVPPKISLIQLNEQEIARKARELELIQKICRPYQPPEDDLLGR